MAVAFMGYSIRGHVRSRSGWSLIAVLGAASVLGATVGVALLPSVSDTALRLLLGSLLIASAARLHRAPSAEPAPASAA